MSGRSRCRSIGSGRRALASRRPRSGRLLCGRCSMASLGLWFVGSPNGCGISGRRTGAKRTVQPVRCMPSLGPNGGSGVAPARGSRVRERVEPPAWVGDPRDAGPFLGAPVLGCPVCSGAGGEKAARMREQAFPGCVCQRNLYARTDEAEGRRAGWRLAQAYPIVGARFQVSLRAFPEGTAARSRVAELCTPLDG